MTQEELQAKHDKLVDLALRMRNYQKRCDQYPISDDRKRKRELERQFDNLLDNEVKDKRSKQQEIF